MCSRSVPSDVGGPPRKATGAAWSWTKLGLARFARFISNIQTVSEGRSGAVSEDDSGKFDGGLLCIRRASASTRRLQGASNQHHWWTTRRTFQASPTATFRRCGAHRQPQCGKQRLDGTITFFWSGEGGWSTDIICASVRGRKRCIEIFCALLRKCATSMKKTVVCECILPRSRTDHNRFAQHRNCCEQLAALTLLKKDTTLSEALAVRPTGDFSLVSGVAASST